ncbi:putative tho complex subunit 7 [Lyophyllum shimeji]|uniref:Tho complex subunit 7 n=1 Tax=Lyophyllum shimeji TaxID=47721 RepID=A0A9P3PED8_LYOSH|nr:putative tho complex subunit 7 [Lyophyllum shimeji]
MAVASSTEALQTSAPRPTAIPPLTTEEEDSVILARIVNDERWLKRVLKKFHNYASVANAPLVPAVIPPASAAETSLEDAREAFLLELATFQLSLKKSAMICEAEARQVEEYERERQRIENEHGILRGQIEQLKAALEEAQMVRRRKIEYDLVAEKVNTLPSREELERSIQALENDMAAIRAEQEHQSRTLYDQKSSLDTIIKQLDYLRFMGKDTDAVSAAASPSATPAPEQEAADVPEEVVETAPTPMDVAHTEGKEEGEEDNAPPESAPSTAPEAVEDDIEMGEVEEDPKNGKPKKKLREDLEEGEASDTSSALSEPPDD